VCATAKAGLKFDEEFVTYEPSFARRRTAQEVLATFQTEQAPPRGLKCHRDEEQSNVVFGCLAPSDEAAGTSLPDWLCVPCNDRAGS